MKRASDACQKPEVPDSSLSDREESGAPILRRGRESLRLLLEAFQYGCQAERSVWEFAVEIATLRAAGCTNNEFRWLVCRGYVEHAPETTLPDQKSRSFRRRLGSPALTFAENTCFVLTEAGVAFAGAVVAALDASEASNPSNGHSTNGRRAIPRLMPHWDPVRQELRLGELVVKQFKVSAANQERVLAAFQEEGWPRRIDDPLPPSPDLDPKRRLHETISSLNRNLLRPWIHFHGDGTGQGIRWRLMIPGETATSSEADDERPRSAAEPPPRLFRPHGEYGVRKTEVRTNRRRKG